MIPATSLRITASRSVNLCPNFLLEWQTPQARRFVAMLGGAVGVAHLHSGSIDVGVEHREDCHGFTLRLARHLIWLRDVPRRSAVRSSHISRPVGAADRPIASPRAGVNVRGISFSEPHLGQRIKSPMVPPDGQSVGTQGGRRHSGGPLPARSPGASGVRRSSTTVEPGGYAGAEWVMDLYGFGLRPPISPLVTGMPF